MRAIALLKAAIGSAARRPGRRANPPFLSGQIHGAQLARSPCTTPLCRSQAQSSTADANGLISNVGAGQQAVDLLEVGCVPLAFNPSPISAI